MKHFFLLLTVLLGFSVHSQFNCQSTKNAFPATGTSIDYNARSDTFDILHTDLQLDIRSFLNVIGRSEIEIAVLQDASKLRLDLQNFQVDSVRVLGGNFTAYNRQNPFLDLNGSFTSGDTLRAIVHYRGMPPADPSGWGGWHRTPNLAFNLGVGFGSNPHVYGRSMFPCFDNFVEHCTFSTSILSLSGQMGVSNGMMISDSTTSLGRETRWELNTPIPSYLYAVAVSDFQHLQEIHQAMNGPIEMDVYARSGDTANARQSFQNLDGILDAFEHYFGPYVWQRVGYVLTTVGAMEHATSIHLPRNLADGTLAGEDIIAHELAHHWFGNLITCERAEDMWINEGWAEYCSHLYEEYVYDRQRYLSTVRNNRDLVLKLAHIRDDGHRALVEMPQDYTYGWHTYQKGAMAAHNLRAYMGDSLFFSSFQQFFQQRAHENFGINDFRLALEQYSGLDLRYFFEDQIEQAGYAQFAIDSIHVSGSPGQLIAAIQLRQSIYAANHLYRAVPLRIALMDGDGQLEIHQIATDTSGAFTNLSINSTLDDISFALIDPDGVLLTAHTPEIQRVDQTGTVSFSDAMMQLTVNQLQDTSWVVVEHHWVAPENTVNPSWNFRLSSRRYWSVQGDFGSSISASANIVYDGRIINGELDNDLLANGEDSIILLYRPHPWSVWEEYDAYTKDVQGSTLNKLGIMRLSELRAGEYCFANGQSGIDLEEEMRKEDSLKVWPNPVNDELHIAFPEGVEYHEEIEKHLYDASGKQLPLPSLRFKTGEDILYIDVSQLGPGSYWLDLGAHTVRFEKAP